MDQVENDTSNLIGYGVESHTATGSKETRAHPLSTAAEEGKVDIERGPWNQEFLDELCAFPTGRHDDIVDAAADAFNYVALASPFEWFA